MNTATQLVRHWLLPPRCPICGALGHPRDDVRRGCAHCLTLLPRLNGRRCLTCARWMEDSDKTQTRCKDCIAGRNFESVDAAFTYAAPLDKLVWRVKFGGEIHLAKWMGGWLADTLRKYDTPRLLIPVPLGRRRLQNRGFNQAEVIARYIGQALGWPVRNDLLTRVIETPAQARQVSSARAKEMANAFDYNARATLTSDTPFMLVDDVMTTGATANGAASTLMNQWPHRSIQVAVFARARPSEKTN